MRSSRPAMELSARWTRSRSSGSLNHSSSSRTTRPPRERLGSTRWRARATADSMISDIVEQVSILIEEALDPGAVVGAELLQRLFGGDRVDLAHINKRTDASRAG